MYLYPPSALMYRSRAQESVISGLLGIDIASCTFRLDIDGTCEVLLQIDMKGETGSNFVCHSVKNNNPWTLCLLPS